MSEWYRGGGICFDNVASRLSCYIYHMYYLFNFFYSLLHFVYV